MSSDKKIRGLSFRDTKRAGPSIFFPDFSEGVGFYLGSRFIKTNCYVSRIDVVGFSWHWMTQHTSVFEESHLRKFWEASQESVYAIRG